MSQHEQRVNEALRSLDEAHRLGHMQRDEYRRRRRALLEALRNRSCTERDTVRRTVSANSLLEKVSAALHYDAGGLDENRAKTRGWADRERLLGLTAAFAVRLGVAGLCIALACWLASRWP
jgi:hypothetical protein